MQEIISRTIGVQDDKRIVLSNGEIMRLMGFLGDWTHARVGIQFSWNGSATISGSPEIAIGFCSGTTNGYADPSTSNFIGLSGIFTTLNFVAGPPDTYVASSNVLLRTKKVGATRSVGAAVLTSAFRGSAAPASVRSALICSVLKGATYQIGGGAPVTQAAAQTDVTDAMFLDMMELSNLDGIGGIVAGYSGGDPNTGFAMDEVTNGPLNAVNIFWNKASVGFEISAVRLRKVS